MEIPAAIICQEYSQRLGGHSQVIAINAIEGLATAYYVLITLLGFRNMYVIFYKQRKTGNYFFFVMYLFTQTACIL